MAKEYKVLQVSLGSDDVESILNHTIKEDWVFLSCVSLPPRVLCYTFWREKKTRVRVEDSSSELVDNSGQGLKPSKKRIK